jgi:membrane-bound lytic murein transglycosylase B
MRGEAFAIRGVKRALILALLFATPLIGATPASARATAPAGLSAADAALDCGIHLNDARFAAASEMCQNGTGEARESIHYGAGAAANLPPPVVIAVPAERRQLFAAERAVLRESALPSDSLIEQVGHRYGVDPRLLAAMVRTESGGRAGAISSKGALGLMQVMPQTARSLGVANPAAMLSDPLLALSAGAAYLKTLQARLGNNVPLVVAAYNAGPGAVMRAGMRIPAYRETQGYVGQVMRRYAASTGAP